MRWRDRIWWHDVWPVLALPALQIPLLIFGLVVTSLPLNNSWTPWVIDEGLSLYLRIAYGCIALITFWLLLMSPWLLSVNDRQLRCREHRSLYRNLKLRAWMPVWFSAASGCLLVLIPVADWFRFGLWEWGRGAWIGVALLVSAGPLGFLAMWWQRYLIARLERTIRTISPRCVACGYDLRGKPAAVRCPECGKAPRMPGVGEEAARL